MLHVILEQRLLAALTAVLPEARAAQVQVRPAVDAKFGDYQSNCVMALAKERKLNPRALASQIVAQLDVSDLCEPVEIAGPGFLNFRIKPSALAAVLAEAARGEHLFFRPATHPKRLVIDFSSPNVAKPMHVGHIRSTGIGDALQRVFRLLGHQVVSDNHLGDWGTQFGKLLVGWKQYLDPAALASDPISEMERLYKRVNAACESDPGILDLAREELVRLQAGDPENLGIWQEMNRLSQAQFDTVYGRLGVSFDQILGESFYNRQLNEVVNDLVARGIARESEGALAVFSDGSLPPKEDPFLVNKDGEWVPDPALIRKSDGGFNYMTTDLATVDYRIRTWSPAQILYVVDDRQGPHFRKLFLTFARWQPEFAGQVKLRHIGFGKILGEDGRPFQTRSGDTIKLTDLLDEAEERALQVVTGKRPELDETTRREIARVVGLGAVKYQDLLPNRQSDYVFSWEKMLALSGNTAPYLQYQFTRANKVTGDGGAYDPAQLTRVIPTEPAELDLTKHLLNFGLTLEAVADECRPNYLCNYLYDLAGLYSRFYENCPVLRSEEPRRTLRLALCDLTAKVLKQGLATLGIEAPQVM